MTDYERRRVLGAVGAGVLGALAGCSGGSTDEPTAGEDDRDAEPSPDESPESTATATDQPGGGNYAWPLAGRTPTNRTFAADGAGAGGEVTVDWTYEYDAPDDAELPRFAHGSPVVADGVVYAAVSGEDLAGESDAGVVSEVVGLDPDSGERVRSMSPAESGPEYVESPQTPVVADGRLYHGGFGLTAFDLASGEVDWERPETIVSGQITAAGGTVYAPVFGDSTVSLVAYDAADGAERWRSDAVRRGAQPPAVTDEAVYVPDGPELVALDRSDGSERWRTNAGVYSYAARKNDATPVTPPTVGDDALYVAGGFRSVLSADAGALVALDRERGEKRWSFRPGDDAGTATPAPDESGPTSLVGGLPALHDGTVYVTGAPEARLGEGYGETELYAVDAADGSLDWRAPTPGMALYVVGSGDSVVVVHGEGVTTHAAADGSVRGEATGDPRPDFLSSNAVADGRVFARVDGGVAAYEFG